MAVKIVFLDEYTVNGSDISAISELGEYKSYEVTEEWEVVRRCEGFDIAITNKAPFTAEIISHLPDLRMICVAATGMNNVDLDAAARAGIVVKNAVDYSTHSVAEQTFAGVLALYKQILYYDEFVKSKAYTNAVKLFDFGRPTYELHAKRWGIVGLGNIGREVAGIAAAFGCEVAYYSTSGRNKDKTYPSKSLEELLAWCDVLSIHAPLSKETYHLLDYHQFSLMKPTAVVANMARGSIINEEGLRRALDDGLIAGAAIDVYSKEPMAEDNPLHNVRDKYKLVLTPHSAWHTREAMQRDVEKVAENIREFLKQDSSR